MRIGMIAPPWIPVPPPAYGGTESVIDGIAVGLKSLGHEVLLAAAPGSTCPVQLVATASRPTSRQIGDLEAERHHVRRAYAALRDADVDLVHDHTLLGPTFGSRNIDVPIVTTAHGPFDEEMLARYRRMPPEVLFVAISASQASKADGVKISRVIHHGIDCGSITPGDGTGGYLAFLGRMTPSKGVPEAIAVARAAGVPLKIAAKLREPAERNFFDRRVAPLLGEGCEYLGELSRDDKFQLLRSAAALLNPIQWDEPFGMVMIEAMATGTPVIATPRGAAPEIVEDGVTGYLRESLPGLAAAVPAVDRLDRQVVRARVAERFSLERLASDYAGFFAEVIADRATSRRRPDSNSLSDDYSVAG